MVLKKLRIIKKVNNLKILYKINAVIGVLYVIPFTRSLVKGIIDFRIGPLEFGTVIGLLLLCYIIDNHYRQV